VVNKIGGSYLSGPFVAKRLKRHFRAPNFFGTDTALHRSKDLAVAPPALPRKLSDITAGASALSHLGVTVRTS